MRRGIEFLILTLILASGCTGVIEGGRDYSDMWGNQIIDRTAIYDEEDIDICGDVECWAMVCDNNTNIWVHRSSFIGGTCRFENLGGDPPDPDAEQRYADSQDRFNELLNTTLTPDENLMTFRVGVGPSFSDFGRANAWCHNSLGLAVQWLVGDEDVPYPYADPGRAVCILREETIPIYVLYSYGQNVDVERTGRIAYRLAHGESFFPEGVIPERVEGVGSPVGPVIITTEMNADFTDPNIREAVIEQARTIKQNCPDSEEGVYCMVALGATMGDYEGVQSILDDPRTQGKIDLLAFGMNSLNATTCDRNELYLGAYNFSRFAWYGYGIPSVIPFVLFDAQGDLEREDGSWLCSWSEGEMIRGYNDLFANIPAFVRNGVIGVAAYDFNSTAGGLRGNPMGCEDCSLGTDIARMSSFFAGCQAYTGVYGTDIDTDEETFRPSPGVPLVFPNQSGGRCSFGSGQWDGIMNMQYGSEGFADFTNPSGGQLRAPLDVTVRCDACMSESIEWPWPYIPDAGGLPGSTSEEGRGHEDPHIFLTDMTNWEVACSGFPELDDWAGRRNLDPMFVRAIAYSESGMWPCSTACTAEGGSGSAGHGCIAGNYNTGYNSMYDPAEVCTERILQKSPQVAPGETPDFRAMGLGLMQVMESPYTFWPDEFCNEEDQLTDCGTNYDQYQDAVETRGRTDNPEVSIAECGPNFNPYNASHAACLGTYKFEVALRAAENIVDEYRSAYGHADLFRLDDDPDKERILEYYIAMHKYGGTWPTETPNPWIADFGVKSAWDEARCAVPESDRSREACRGFGILNDEAPYCYGVTDFLEFVTRCKIDEEYGGELRPGYNKLSLYRYLNENCPTAGCPSWRSTAETLDIEIECSNPLLCPPAADD